MDKFLLYLIMANTVQKLRQERKDLGFVVLQAPTVDVRNCPLSTDRGIGGFVTVGFGAAEAYVQSMTNDWTDDMQNVTGTYSSLAYRCCLNLHRPMLLAGLLCRSAHALPLPSLSARHLIA